MELRWLFRKYPWTVRPVALLLLIVSPVVLPILVCIEHADDFADAYRDILMALKKGGDIAK